MRQQRPATHHVSRSGAQTHVSALFLYCIVLHGGDTLCGYTENGAVSGEDGRTEYYWSEEAFQCTQINRTGKIGSLEIEQNDDHLTAKVE